MSVGLTVEDRMNGPQGGSAVRPSPKYITCPVCGWTSFHATDVAERYCAHCHRYHDEMTDREIQHATGSRARLEDFSRTRVGRAVFQLWDLTIR